MFRLVASRTVSSLIQIPAALMKPQRLIIMPMEA
jgi:hypothetical protein